MPRIHFQQQLVALKDKLLAMAALSQQALEFSVEAYINRDLSLASHVREVEEAINSAEREVDEMAYDLLAKEQPMAIDLRFILSVIKINSDLERIGDQSTNIASQANKIDAQPAIQLPVDIEDMGARVGVMIRTAIQSLLEGDTSLAESVISMDDQVDEMNRAIQSELVSVMQQHGHVAEQALSAIIVSRNLERAADHATNIAEDVIFWVRGADVRHKFSMVQSVEDRHLPIN
jgi:phosphate transport system protein